MAAGKGNKIEANDYTTIFNTINPILGLGAGTTATSATGYGIVPASSLALNTVSQNLPITSEQWGNLRSDILAARIHQEGTPNSLALTNPTKTTQITETDRAAYLAMAQDAALLTNRFKMGANQSGIIDLLNPTGSTSVGVRSTAWNGTISHTVTITFTPTAAQSSAFNTGQFTLTGGDLARFFFNSGSYFRISAGRWDDYPANTATGANGTKNYSWNRLLSNMGYIYYKYDGASSSASIGAFSGLQGYYAQRQSLGTNYAFYTNSLAGSDLYSPNQYNLTATVSNGGATITFLIQFKDLSTGITEAASGANPSAPGHSQNTIWAVDENVTGTLFSKVEAVYALNGGVSVVLPAATSTTL